MISTALALSQSAIFCYLRYLKGELGDEVMLEI
jgi:hypothetical protein